MNKKTKNLIKGGIKTMKSKTIISLISALLLCITSAFAVITVEPNKVAQVYDYSNFAQTGGVTKVYDPVNDKYTFVYNNATVTGYYGTDGSFIREQVVTKYANGATAKIEDLINNRVKEFNPEGAITKAYTIGPDGQTYEAAISYSADGGYTISWKGLIDKDGDPNTTDDQEVISDAVVEKYDAAGRLLEVTNKTWNKDKGAYETATTKYIYDGAGNLVRTESYSSDNKLLSVTYFDSLGRQSYTIAYKYDDGGKLLYTYLASKNFYDGLKLVKTENYEPSGEGTQKLQSTVYYDNHGRISYVTDAEGRETARYFYNDTGQTIADTVQFGGRSVPISAKPGQIIKVEGYSYGDNGSKATVTTYYRNNYAVIQVYDSTTVYDVDAYNEWLKQRAPDIPVGVDPSVDGELKLVKKDDGEYVVLDITDKEEVEKLVSAIKQAKDQWGSALDSFFDKILDTLGDTNHDGTLSNDEWNAKGGKVELYVGAINSGVTKGYGQSGGGNAQSTLDTQSNWNDTLMKALITELITANQTGQKVTGTFTWTYWAFDQKGNLWIFVEGRL